MDRCDALRALLGALHVEDLALFTTGMISREAYGLRDRPENFYMMGSMGLLSSMGLGLALSLPGRRVVVVEGDGSALMSLGSLALIAQQSPPNFTHVVLDNEAYESTGNQPSISATIDLAAQASACGYRLVGRCLDLDSFTQLFAEHRASPGPSFLLAKVGGRASHGLARLDIAPPALKDRFRAAAGPGRASS